jgi:hypothetical protein
MVPIDGEVLGSEAFSRPGLPALIMPSRADQLHRVIALLADEQPRTEVTQVHEMRCW